MLTEEDNLIIHMQSLIAGYMKKQFEKAIEQNPPPAVDLIMMDSGRRIGDALWNTVLGKETIHKTVAIDNPLFQKGALLSLLQKVNDYVTSNDKPVNS